MSILRLYHLKYLTSIIYFPARSDGISFLGYNLLSIFVSLLNLYFQSNIILVFSLRPVVQGKTECVAFFQFVVHFERSY